MSDITQYSIIAMTEAIAKYQSDIDEYDKKIEKLLSEKPEKGYSKVNKLKFELYESNLELEILRRKGLLMKQRLVILDKSDAEFNDLLNKYSE